MMEEDTKSNAECHEALMKMTYCPKCIGIEGKSRPCSGYCLNVLRGCLSKYVAELDSPWNGYVEVIERLVNAMKQHNNEVGVNADAVIKGLDTRISEAIMYAMERSKEIDGRVSYQSLNCFFRAALLNSCIVNGKLIDKSQVFVVIIIWFSFRAFYQISNNGV